MEIKLESSALSPPNALIPINSNSLIWNEISIVVDPETGFVDATALMKAGGKRFNHWFDQKSTQEYLREFEADLSQNSDAGIPASEFSTIIKKGTQHQHTFVHRLVAYHMLSYLNPKFGVQVCKWLDELFITGKVELNHETPTAELNAKYMQQIDKLNATVADQSATIATQSNTISSQLQDLTVKDQTISTHVETITSQLNILTIQANNLSAALDRCVDTESVNPQFHFIVAVIKCYPNRRIYFLMCRQNHQRNGIEHGIAYLQSHGKPNCAEVYRLTNVPNAMHLAHLVKNSIIENELNITVSTYRTYELRGEFTLTQFINLLRYCYENRKTLPATVEDDGDIDDGEDGGDIDE